jgi:DNA-binding MarR family transcriptional regulator
VTEETTPYDSLMIGALLTFPVQVIGRRVTAALVEQGFTDYRHTYQPVFQFCQPEGSRLTELAKHAGITKQSMAEIIDVLEQRGYIERIPDPTDGRAMLIRRTQRGWEINRVAREVVEQIQQEWAQTLGEERFKHLLETLRQLALFLNEPLGAGGHPEANKPPKKR